MASSDVDSLFTNIPSDETIDICVNKLFQNPENLVNKISKNYFFDLLNKITKKNHFLHLKTSFRFKWIVLLWSPL